MDGHDRTRAGHRRRDDAGQLGLLTGNIGTPVAASIRCAGRTCRAPAHMARSSRTRRGAAEHATFAGVGRGVVGARGLSMLHMMDAAAEGKLKALWCIGYDILFSNITSATRRALTQLELLIVQDLFMNETAREFAHVVLPAASPLKRTALMNGLAFVPPPRREPAGAGAQQWQITGDNITRGRTGAAFAFTSAAEIWNGSRKCGRRRQALSGAPRAPRFRGPVRMNTIRARRCCIEAVFQPARGQTHRLPRQSEQPDSEYRSC